MSNEGSIRNQRAEFVRESQKGVFPTDPTFEAFSDNITSVDWSPTPGVSERRGIGSPDVATFHNGPEEHELTVEYDLQRWVIDGNGDPNDATGDGVLRNANNDLPNTHGVVIREENLDVPASETVNGATSKDTRLYLVGIGGRVSSVTYSGDPGSDQPVTVEVTYTFEKIREYQLDQPGTDDTLDITNNGSSVVDVTVEDEGAVTAEALSIPAGSTYTTTASFDNLDAVELSGDIDGDVVVAESTSGDDLVRIRGSNHYGHGEGDEGVPALGSGSHAGAVGTAYETILDDTIERPSGTGLGYEINSVEFTVENELDTREQIGTPRMAISAGNRTVEVSTTLVGPTESVQQANEALGEVGANLVWSLSGGSLQADNARLTDFSGVSKSEGEAAMSLDNTFTGETVTVN